jgi:hypothetical protein
MFFLNMKVFPIDLKQIKEIRHSIVHLLLLFLLQTKGYFAMPRLEYSY